ncbi:MAG: hypothetical protein ACOCQ0_02835 [Desulfosalsimonas sp.]
MKVYTKVVIDMESMEVLEEESFEYDGALAHCGSSGGGGGSEGAPDFYYEHLVRSGEQETEMARELMNFYKHGTFKGEGEAYSGPSYADMERRQIKANYELIPQQAQQEQLIMEERAPVLRQYFQEAQNVDPEARANRAQAETSQQFEQARDQATRNITRTGATPGSNRASAMMGDLATQQAKATSAAKNIARRRGEEEKFNRLSQAVGGAG